MNLPIYLDNNATTPCDPRVREEMLPYFSKNFGNAASRTHSYGWIAEDAVDIARERIARLIGAEVQEIIFTSGATEAANLAVKGVFETYAAKGNHIITAGTEHPAVLESCVHISKKGAEITFIPVKNDGLLDLNKLEAAIKPETILIALMYANHETGVIQQVDKISAIARKYHILFFSDAAQTVGKIAINVNKDGIDLMSFSAHKMYGPKGIGALYVRRKNPRVKLTAQIDGGGHERKMRSGTLNVPAIAGFGKAAELARLEMKEEGERLRQLRDQLERHLLSIEGVSLNGNSEHRLPHVSNLSINNRHLVENLSETVAFHSSASHSSNVLKAMGLSDQAASKAVRLSLGRFNDEHQIDYLIEQITVLL